MPGDPNKCPIHKKKLIRYSDNGLYYICPMGEIWTADQLAQYYFGGHTNDSGTNVPPYDWTPQGIVQGLGDMDFLSPETEESIKRAFKAILILGIIYMAWRIIDA